MRAIRVVTAWCILWMACGAWAGGDGESRLRYSIGRKGDAGEASLAQPGYESAYALRLDAYPRTWSRWNLPLFEAREGVKAVRLAARREGEQPERVLMRVLESDGSEWSSRVFEVGEQWRDYRFEAKDFRYFRSRDARRGTTVRLDRAVQVQFVPMGEKGKDVALFLDDVSLEPGGPRWTFEEDEQVKPVSEAEALAEQFAFMDATHEAQMGLASEYREWQAARVASLRELAAGVKASDSFEDIVARYGEKARRGEFAFLKPAPVFSVPPESDAAQREKSLAKLRERVRTYNAKPLRYDAASPSLVKQWRMNTLYAAPKQSDPVVVAGEAGARAICQKVKFVKENRQVVFLYFDLPETLDVQDRYDTIRIRTRLTSNAFHPTENIRMRAYSKGGPNAWTDATVMTSKDVKVGEWQTWDVPIHRLGSGIRFDPRQFRSMGFRIENNPGHAVEFDFCVEWIELSCRVPERLAEASLRREQRAELARAQMASLPPIEEGYQATRAFSPALRRFWLWAGMWHPEAAAQADSATPAPALAESPKEPPKGMLRVVSDAAVVEGPRAGMGRLSLWLDCAAGKETNRYEVALFDHAGACVYAGRATPDESGRATLVADQEGVYYWWPGCPYLYTLRVGAFGEKGALDVMEKPLGFCSVAYRESDLSGAMRHARGAARRDWSAWVNGQAWFPQGTRATISGAADEMDGPNLFRELWVEFQRNYGSMPLHRESGAFLREGLMETCSLRASYASIGDYTDAQGIWGEYAQRLRQWRPGAVRANVLHYAVGNEVELNIWGADLSAVYGDDVWQPMEKAARMLRETVGRNRPVCYVRAGQFRRVPDLPSDDMAGVNHYPGRYFGRIEQIAGDLSNLSANTLLRGWPLYISEWNGPKYTWASTGIGGCTERGCAFYIAKYWDAMTRTPGVTVSSEFVLNWVATAIEDLTTVPIEEGMKRRGKYNKFGGGHTAGHVPWIFPDRLDRGHTFDYMRGFHSPLYFLVNTPGELAILHTARGAEAARRIARPLRAMGKRVRVEEITGAHRLAELDTNLLILGEAGSDQPALIEDLEARRTIGAVLPDFPRAGLPLVQRRVHPAFPDRAMVVVTASDATGYDDATSHLEKAAEGLLRIQREAATVRRLLVFGDRKMGRIYQGVFNEFATRGFFHDFDDFRQRIDGDELLERSGALRPRYANLGAVLVDLPRAMDASELATLRRLNTAGVNVVVSWPCYEANDALRQAWGVRASAPGSLTESLPVAQAWQASLKVPEMGHARPERMREFVRFKKGELEGALRVMELGGAGWEAVATRGKTGGPVVVAGRPWGDGGRCFVFGTALHEVFALHRKVTRSGKTHNLYDRGTACGLERVARVAVNCLRAGMPLAEDAAALRGRVETDRSFVRPGERLRVDVQLTDASDRPVSGAEVLACARYGDTFRNRRKSGNEAYVELKETAPGSGRYALRVAVGESKGDADTALGKWPEGTMSGCRDVVVELKAWKAGHVLYEGAATAILVE